MLIITTSSTVPCPGFSTNPTAETYSQILDGLPLAQVATHQRYHQHWDVHPINRHVALCPGVEEAARNFRAKFEIDLLKFDTKVCRPKHRRFVLLDACADSGN
jgi:hypothetical protein